MKRYDQSTNAYYEVLFTEAAYSSMLDSPRHIDETSVRLKSNYKGYDKVYLMRLITEQNADNLEYHSEAYWGKTFIY